MRTLSGTLATELGLTITRPGYLVSIAFGTPLYLSTLGDLSFNGRTWVGADVKVSGLRTDEKSQQSGTISFGNMNLAYGSLVLNEGVADRAIEIYSVWAGAPADAMLEFSGTGDSADVGERVTITLSQSKSRVLYSPRRFIGASTGFNTLLPNGTTIKIGQQSYILKR